MRPLQPASLLPTPYPSQPKTSRHLIQHPDQEGGKRGITSLLVLEPLEPVRESRRQEGADPATTIAIATTPTPAIAAAPDYLVLLLPLPPATSNVAFSSPKTHPAGVSPVLEVVALFAEVVSSA